VRWRNRLAVVARKPHGILAAAYVTAKGAPPAGKLPVSWRELSGTASSAGVGFTVPLLIASRALDGAPLEEAKLGILATALLSPLVAGASFWPLHRARDEDGRVDAAPLAVPDLAADVDPARDHIRGPVDAPVTLVAYASFGCRYSSAAASVIGELLDRLEGQARYVYRHLPLTDIEPDAQLAAEAVEAAGEQGAFWEMHDQLSSQPEQVSLDAIYRAARALDLDLDRFFADLGRHAHAGQIARDVRSADRSNVAGTPAFFINGRRYAGAFDLAPLTAALRAAASTPTTIRSERAHGTLLAAGTVGA
jgi:protein-disulfide isomerase